MSREETPPSPSRYTVLPPVVRNERDRVFLREMQDFLANEMREVDENDKKQRYIIHSVAFSKLIQHATAYKPLLTRVKKEYDDLIKAIERGKHEASYLNDKIQSMAQEPSTVRNYKRRSDELARRIDIVKKDNERLMKEVADLRGERVARELAFQKELESKIVKPKRTSKSIPGLTLEQTTDIPTLQNELVKVESNLKELSVSKRSKFTERNNKETLKAKLAVKVQERDLLQQRNNWLIAKQKRLKIAHDSAMNYINSDEPQYRTIGDVILLAMARNKPALELEPKLNRDTSGTLEDDDPTKEREAEQILEYIERFNELFEDTKYEEAAIHAANSPKGILRTMETMARFKGVSAAHEEGRPPWLAFCDAIMSSVLALGVKPSDTMSLECVMCVLKENRLDLLSHWIAQDRLTVTEKLGDLISDHCKGKNRTYLDMAESIYRSCLAHKKVVTVLVRQGLHQRALEYAKDKAFTTHEYTDLLSKFPSSQFAFCLVELTNESGECLIPLGFIVRALVSSDSHEAALQLLQKLFLRSPEETGSEYNGLRQAVFLDSITTQNQWHEIIKISQEYGYEEVALELLAAVTVNKAIRFAHDNNYMSEKTTSELNFSSQPTSQQRNRTGTTKSYASSNNSSASSISGSNIDRSSKSDSNKSGSSKSGSSKSSGSH